MSHVTSICAFGLSCTKDSGFYQGDFCLGLSLNNMADLLECHWGFLVCKAYVSYDLQSQEEFSEVILAFEHMFLVCSDVFIGNSSEADVLSPKGGLCCWSSISSQIFLLWWDSHCASPAQILEHLTSQMLCLAVYPNHWSFSKPTQVFLLGNRLQLLEVTKLSCCVLTFFLLVIFGKGREWSEGFSWVAPTTCYTESSR